MAVFYPQHLQNGKLSLTLTSYAPVLSYSWSLYPLSTLVSAIAITIIPLLLLSHNVHNFGGSGPRARRKAACKSNATLLSPTGNKLFPRPFPRSKISLAYPVGRYRVCELRGGRVNMAVAQRLQSQMAGGGGSKPCELGCFIKSAMITQPILNRFAQPCRDIFLHLRAHL